MSESSLEKPLAVPGGASDGGRSPRRPDRKYDFLVTHRLNGFTSGVARFNQILAEGLDLPLVFLFGDELPHEGRPLLSFKVSELSDVERVALDALLDTV